MDVFLLYEEIDHLAFDRCHAPAPLNVLADLW